MPGEGTLLDRVLAHIAPARAARRAEARLRLERIEQVRRLRLDYDAAQVGRRTDGWRRVGTSANAELGPALHVLRNGARELVRNDPYAAKAVRTFVAHLVGSGIRPRPIVDDAEERARLTERWSRFVETCDPEGRLDWYGLQRLAARAVFESGEALLLWTPRASGDGLSWTVQVLEPDYLDTYKTGRIGENVVIQGVEFDPRGRRVAYWLYDQHPGDSFGLSLGGWQSRRVSARVVDHVFDTLRPGQVRGVPWLAPSAMTMHDLRGLAEAELVRKKLEACIAGVVTYAEPPDDAVIGKPLTDADGNLIDEMAPGMWLHAGQGHDVKYLAPEASAGLVEHMKERLHAVAAGVGLTYHQLTGDLSEANYSSLRGGLVEFRQMLDGWQADLMIAQCCRPAWRRVMGEDAPPARYIVPPRPWVDPQKDIEARIRAVEAYFDSPQDVVAERGQDWTEQLDEIAEWQRALQERGLTSSAAEGGAAQTERGAEE